MATKTGRNEPCPCGSGKKYKQCCLRKDEDAERKSAAARGQAAKSVNAGNYSEIADQLEADYEDELALTEASNAAAALVRAGKLDEAEAAARDLLQRFPYVHDGYDRLGMVYEARGENKQAADYYRQALAFIREHPDQYAGSDMAGVFERLIAELDPQTP